MDFSSDNQDLTREQEDVKEVIFFLSQTEKYKNEIFWTDHEESSLSITVESLEEILAKESSEESSEKDSVGFQCYCEGLLCYQLYPSRQPFVINPLKEEVLFIREPPQRFSRQAISDSSYALGVSGSTGKHKLVILEHLRHRSDNNWHAYNVADVMTLGSPEWRVIWQVPRFKFTKPPIFERGFLYWLSHENHIPQQLIAFNVESEVFSTIDTPSHVDLIVDLGGYLGLVYAGSKSLTVWFGTRHNAHGQIIEWGERGTITIVHEGKCINPSELDLLGVWKDSTVLLSWIGEHKVFFSYDFVTRSVRVVEYPIMHLFEYKSFKSSSFSIAEFHGSSDLVYLPPGQIYDTSRSGLIKRLN